MKNLKILRCCEFESLRDLDLVNITHALPRLEELDIRSNRNMSRPLKVGYPTLSDQFVTDAGIEVISRSLRGLHSIDISGNCFCSDPSLIALSSNCVLLSEIKCRGCNMTRRGIDWVLSHSTNLTSLQARFYGLSGDSAFSFDDMEISATGLRELDIGGFESTDHQERFLCSIAKVGIPLEKLSLCYSRWSKHGVMSLLRSCPTLKHLKLRGGHLLNDNILRDICPCLPNMVSIELNYCYSITTATFSIFAKECPALTKITLSNGSLGHIQYHFATNLERNHRVRYLDLSYSWGLKDKLLKDIVVACPNLRTLKVGGLNQLTKEGLEEILKCCPQIKHLKSKEYGEILSKHSKLSQIKIEHGSS